MSDPVQYPGCTPAEAAAIATSHITDPATRAEMRAKLERRLTDREKLEAVAASYNKLMELMGQRNRTGALLIRTCVKAITREITSFDNIERRRRIRQEKDEAIACLKGLADMMDPPV